MALGLGAAVAASAFLSSGVILAEGDTPVTFVAGSRVSYSHPGSPGWRGIHGPADDPLPRAPGGGSTTIATNLTYQGTHTSTTAVEKSPQVWVDFWGDWTATGDPVGEQPYLHDFLSNIGGGSWNNTVTQYCEGIQHRTQDCTGAPAFTGNPSGLLKSTWNDTTNPVVATDRGIAQEAATALQHFGSGVDLNNAEIVVALPNGQNPPGFPNFYCAYHSYLTVRGVGTVSYTNLPYQPNCLPEFGTGAASIVEGHELAESETDPFIRGWYESDNRFEIGDKCENLITNPPAPTVTKGGAFLVQSLWSNAAGTCVFMYP
jgi:serine protease